jgi:tetratricopeptide (TPR) repeat protein
MKEVSLLLVDDNLVGLQMLTDTLRYLGYKNLQESTSASEAWAIMRVKEFTGIISAWDMPEMSGLALLKIVRNDDRNPDLPFYLTESEFTKAKILEAGRAGASGLIVTPFDTEVMKKKIEDMAELAGMGPPSEVEISLGEGMELLEGGDHEAALQAFEKMLSEGESAEVYYNIGYIKTAQGFYEEGIKAFRKATQLNRLFAKAYEAMGRAYKELGKPKEAEKSLHKAAEIYMSKEKDEDAEEVLNEILELQPDTINVYNSLGVLCRKRGQFEAALSHYQKAVKIHPEEPFIYYNIGRCHMDMKNPKAAEGYFRRAVKLKPDFQEAREVLNAIELSIL